MTSPACATRFRVNDVIPGRRAAASPGPKNTGLWNMGSGLASGAPE